MQLIRASCSRLALALKITRTISSQNIIYYLRARLYQDTALGSIYYGRYRLRGGVKCDTIDSVAKLLPADVL